MVHFSINYFYGIVSNDERQKTQGLVLLGNQQKTEFNKYLNFCYVQDISMDSDRDKKEQSIILAFQET